MQTFKPGLYLLWLDKQKNKLVRYNQFPEPDKPWLVLNGTASKHYCIEDFADLKLTAFGSPADGYVVDPVEKMVIGSDYLTKEKFNNKNI